MRHWATAMLALLAGSVWATDKPPAARKDVVSWERLADVRVVRESNRYVPEFAKDIVALDRKEVKLQGFMMPLEMGLNQKRFLLSAMPSDCGFCVPGSAEQFAEVLAKRPVRYVREPIVVVGRFELVRDDTGGLLYRLTDAVPID